MTITDVIALVALSLLGLIFWIALAGISTNVERMLAAMPTPPAKIRTSVKSHLLILIAVAMVVVPWLLMIISVAQRVIA